MSRIGEPRVQADLQQDAEDRDTVAALFQRTLHSLRLHLGMEVAFVSEFEQGRRHFRHVDADARHHAVRVGGHGALEPSFCARIADGSLPGVLHDAAAHPLSRQMAAQQAFPIGAHLGVPIVLADGRVFGTLCCFSARPNHELDTRDLGVLQVFADVVAEQAGRDRTRATRRQSAADRIDGVLRSLALDMLYQPIVNVAHDVVVGFEALARFGEPQRTPDVWFAEAASVGRGVELESLAITRALAALDRLPPSVYVAVNASPATVADGHLAALLADVPLERVVVEVTEHQAVERYDDLVAAVRPLQARGLRIAIDDAGAGYASFRHILNLAPHMIKLDVSITRGIDQDRSRRALAAALCRFAQETQCRIVAEGVETAGELATLRALGFEKAQGYFLGRPMTLDDAVARCAAAPASTRS